LRPPDDARRPPVCETHQTTHEVTNMAKVIAELSMSLDGFIADKDDEVGPLFDWYNNGDITVPSADPCWTWHVSEASARHLLNGLGNVGAEISGRRLFDFTDGWGGHTPTGTPVFVVTHGVPDGWPREGVPFTFVTDGVESAVAQATAVAGDKIVSVAGPNIIQQCLNTGLLDEIVVNLVPVLFGDGIRFFDNLSGTPIELDDPQVIEGTRVTHLRYRVRKPGRPPVNSMLSGTSTRQGPGPPWRRAHPTSRPDEGFASHEQ
jgi:dihydrofolate reductase